MAAWGGPTGETAVLLDANNQAGPGPNHLCGLCQLLHRGQHRGSDGELLRFPELVRREPQDEPAPRPAASARGRCSGRSAPTAENRAGEEKAGRRLRLSLSAYVSRKPQKKEDDTELDFAREAVMNRASEHNLVSLLDKWSTRWKRRGRTRAIGPHAYEEYCTLGFFGHGGVFDISRASEMKQACIAVNHFLRALSDSNMDFHCRAVQSVNAAASRRPEHDRACEPRYRFG